MKKCIAIMILLISSLHAHAEQFELFDNLEVHYSAIPTTFLTAEIANNYQIQRSKYAALLNISVLDRQNSNEAVNAALHGEAVNLIGHKTTLKFREVREGQAIYYLAELPHTNEEQFKISINVTTLGGVTNQLNFQQTFYTDN